MDSSSRDLDYHGVVRKVEGRDVLILDEARYLYFRDDLVEVSKLPVREEWIKGNYTGLEPGRVRIPERKMEQIYEAIISAREKRQKKAG